LYNFAFIIAADTAIVHFWGWYSLVYLIMSSFFAGSLHPCAAHFIAEHYLMNEVEDTPVPGSGQAMGQETTSYYGWLNVLCYNVSHRPYLSSFS
jgi:sphingolipid delta-4 desaturase